MELGIKNKVVVVTGGSKVLGKAVSFSLATEGAKLAICARDEKTLNEVKNEIEDKFNSQVFVYPCDLKNKDEIYKFKDEVIKKFEMYIYFI